MTFYVLDAIRDLEEKFGFLARTVLQKYAHKTLPDVCNSFEAFPFSIQQKYKYLIEDNKELFKEAATVGEFMIKVSIYINFMNSHDLMDHMIRKHADAVETKCMAAFLKDVRTIMSRITLSDFAGLWVASVPQGTVELTLELDSHWQYKSLEDLRNFQLHYPHRYWYFKKVIVADDCVSVVYAVPKTTRLYQIEQNSLRSYDVIAVHVGCQTILDYSTVSCVLLELATIYIHFQVILLIIMETNPNSAFL